MAQNCSTLNFSSIASAELKINIEVFTLKISRVRIENFRGIAQGELLFSGHAVLVGDNNTGKSTVLEAIDLVLGPERLSRRPIIDEHDFYAGRYIGDEENPIEIQVEVVVVDLTEEQTRHLETISNGGPTIAILYWEVPAGAHATWKGCFRPGASTGTWIHRRLRQREGRLSRYHLLSISSIGWRRLHSFQII